MKEKVTKKELNRKAAIAGAFYVFAQLFVRGITFIVTPIYSRLVSQAQYGEIRVYESWLLLMVPLMSLCLYRSVERAKFDFPDSFEAYVSSAQTLSYLTILVGYSIITVFFRKIFMNFCGLNGLMYVFMILYTFSYTSFLYYQRRERQLLRYKSSTFMTAVTMIPATLLSILLLYLGNLAGKTEWLVELRVIGFYTPQVIGGLALAFLMCRQGHFAARRAHWSYALKFSLPLIPEMLSIQIMNQSDKIMIQKMVDSESAGIFALATTVSFIIWIIEDAVWAAWLPWLYEKMSRDEVSEIRKPWYFIVCVFGLFSWLLVILSPEIIAILGGYKYQMAVYLVAPMVTGTLFRFFSNCFTAVENYQRKTAYCALGTAAAMVLNVVLNAVFISLFGYQAAAYTTAFSYFALLIFQGWLEKKVCGMRCVSLAKMALLSVLFAAVNIGTNYTLGMPWYFRWAAAAAVGLLALKTAFPYLKLFAGQLKK